jgi:hypothetical protein
MQDLFSEENRWKQNISSFATNLLKIDRKEEQPEATFKLPINYVPY